MTSETPDYVVEFVNQVDRIKSVEHLITFWSERTTVPANRRDKVNVEINSIFLRRLCELLEVQAKEYLLENWDPILYVYSSARQLEGSLLKIYSYGKFKRKIWKLLRMLKYPGFPSFTLEDSLLRLVVNIGHDIVLQMKEEEINNFVNELFKWVYDTYQEFSSTRTYSIYILSQILKSQVMQSRFRTQVNFVLSEIFDIKRIEKYMMLKVKYLSTEDKCANTSLLSTNVGCWDLRIIRETLTKSVILNFLFAFASNSSWIKIKNKKELTDCMMTCINLYNNAKYPRSDFTLLAYSAICVLAECLQNEGVSNNFIRSGGMQLLLSLRHPGLCHAPACFCIKNLTFYESNLTLISLLDDDSLEQLCKYLVWNIESSYNSCKICCLIAVRCCLHVNRLLDHFDRINGIVCLFNSLTTRLLFCDFIEKVRGEKSKKYYRNGPFGYLFGNSKTYSSTIEIDYEMYRRALSAIRDYLICHLKLITTNKSMVFDDDCKVADRQSNIKPFIIQMPSLLELFDSHDIFMDELVKRDINFMWTPVTRIVQQQCIPLIIKVLYVAKYFNDHHGQLDVVTSILDITSVVTLIPSVRKIFYEKRSYVLLSPACTGISSLLQYIRGDGLYCGYWKYSVLRILNNFLVDIDSQDIAASDHICDFIHANNLLFELSTLLYTKEPTVLSNYIRYAAAKCLISTITRSQQVREMCKFMPSLQRSSLRSICWENSVVGKDIKIQLNNAVEKLMKVVHATNGDPRENEIFARKNVEFHRNMRSLVKIRMDSEMDSKALNGETEHLKYLYSNYSQERVMHSGQCTGTTKFTAITFGNNEKHCYVAVSITDNDQYLSHKLYNLDLNHQTLKGTEITFHSEPVHLSLHKTGSTILIVEKQHKRCSFWNLTSEMKIEIEFDHDIFAEFGPYMDKIIGTTPSSARIYDIASSKKVLEFTPSSTSNSYTCNISTFSPDEKKILHDGILVDINSNSAIYKFPKLVSRNNGKFNIAREYEILQGPYIWDTRNYKVTEKVDQLADLDIQFGKDSCKLFAYRTNTMNEKSDTIAVYQNKHTYPRILTLPVIQGYLLDFSLAPDEMTIATVEQNNNENSNNTFLQLYRLCEPNQNHFLQDSRYHFDCCKNYNFEHFGILGLQNDNGTSQRLAYNESDDERSDTS